MKHAIPTLFLLPLLGACAGDQGDDTGGAEARPAASGDLANRAYVVSEQSNEMFVFDYDTLEVIGTVDTTVRPGEVNANHMAIVTPDASKIYVSASHENTMVVVDAATLEVTGMIPVGAHNGHVSFRPGTTELWIMEEDDNTVSIVDTETDEVVRRLSDDSFAVPHFARFSGDYAYIANIQGNQVSVVDLGTFQVVDTLVAEGTEMGTCTVDPCGFADAQISSDGILYASHIETGRTLVYDTVNHERLGTVEVGGRPWSAFVNPFVTGEDAALVPSWEEQTVTRVTPAIETLTAAVGDSEVYGINYSATAPGEAFVLNRNKEQVAVIDAATGELIDTIDVGGTTETGTTTPDGRLLVPVSSANSMAVIDTATREILATYEDVGIYPWSVATASGQNYCH